MKHTLTIVSGLLLLATVLHAEGPLTPPGAPAPTMKTLQEIWDEITALKAQLNTIQGVITKEEVTMEMVTVGNAGNAADTTGDPNPAGAVAYEYRIGKYEVTNAQYTQFLNAMASTSTNGLYSSSMGSDVRGGITRSGVSGSYTYAVKAFMGDKPVNYVSWYDALRFCNWLHNGQPTGLQDSTTTEDGAYTLAGATAVDAGTDPTHGANGRNAGARFHLPSENEWYKAAHHEPGASTNSYWLYPTRSDSAPTVATADVFGNIDNDTVNIANHSSGANWNGQTGNMTTVGSGGPGSQSFYGAADMGGNLYEWNEQDISGNRGRRGGMWTSSSPFLRSSARFDSTPANFSPMYGFRVAGP